MISVEYMSQAGRSPAGDARAGERWSDLDLPSWEEFTSARDRFFAELRRRHSDEVVSAGEATRELGSGPDAEP